MRRLTDIRGESLWRGDIVRLVHNYDLGPGSEPVDLMVYDPGGENDGLGLIVVSGYKAGLTLSILPAESLGKEKRSLSVAWLLDHWDEWFCYTYHLDAAGRPMPVPVEGTVVLDWAEREIVVTPDAHSRPA